MVPSPVSLSLSLPGSILPSLDLLLLLPLGWEDETRGEARFYTIIRSNAISFLLLSSYLLHTDGS